MADRTQIVAGTSLARDGFGVLLCGPPGIGKSDLALRAITTPICLPGEAAPKPFELVSDDQTTVAAADGQLMARAPRTISGQLEVRGIGIVDVANAEPVPIVLIANLTHATPERMPERPLPLTMIAGCALATIALRPLDASAPIKLALALQQVTSDAGGSAPGA